MGAAFSFDDVGLFPTSGTPVTMTVCCSHTGERLTFSEFRGRAVTSDWTAGHLELVLQTLTGVHPASMKLLFAGRAYQESETIQSILGLSPGDVPSRLTFFMHVDRTSFPQQLGPFATPSVDIRASDIVMPALSQDGAREGFYWELQPSALHRVGLKSTSSSIVGQVSPLHPITCGDAEREGMCIPKGAASFAWSYASTGWDEVESDAYVLDTWRQSHCGAAALRSFLSVGGYVYFSAEGFLLGATTIGRPMPGDEGDLRFAEAKRWPPEWTKALVEQGRFQPITIKGLRDLGARMYMWLRPHEIIEGPDGSPLPTQPDVPHGGFAYLFHDNLLSKDEAEVTLDRYFSVELDGAPEPAPEAKGEIPASPVKPSAIEAQAAPLRALTLVEQKGQLDSGDLTARTIEPIAEDFASQEDENVDVFDVPSLGNGRKRSPVPPILGFKQI
mmetsp:Transcript_40520/g.114601  ORF Transcript_40520/g.114601 Transcript_40520/m.114601 type:complete len:445 (-) Transcript_40520:143-1477(-)